jgi:hypothetical protein
MKNKNTGRQILRAHYLGVLRRTAVWLGAASVLASMLYATPVSAAQITSRSVTVGNSKGGATTNYDFTFTPPSSTTAVRVLFQICDSPLQLTSCAQSSGASGADLSGATFNTASPTTAPFTSNWATGTSGQAPSATSFYIAYNTGNNLSGSSRTVELTGVKNPTAANTEYYARIYTYSDTAATTVIDYGAMALGTGQEMTVQANVQESLVFKVGASGGCTPSGTSVNIGTGADNVLSSSSASAGTSTLCVNTNALSGFTVAYISNSSHNNAFTNGSHDFGDNSSGNTFSGASAGTNDFFGINVVNNTGASGGPTAGAACSGGVTPTSYGSAYGTDSTYGFVHGTLTTLYSETTGPTANDTCTVTYAGEAGTTTNTGAYQVKINYVATGTF